MGTTGSSISGKVNTALPELISRVRHQTPVPLAVGFGVATRDHFEFVANAGADGVVVGSRIVSVVKNAGLDVPKIATEVEAYCRELTLKGTAPVPPVKSVEVNGPATPALPIPQTDAIPPSVTVDTNKVEGDTILPGRFGQFGGQYVPEALVDCLAELEETHNKAMADPEFWKEFESYFGYINRPSQLYEATRLSEVAGGARIWLKREDL